MWRIAAILLLFALPLLSCSNGFQSCLKKVQDLHVISQNSLKVPMYNDVVLLFSTKSPKNFIKKDPFLSLYLVKSQKVAYPFRLNRFLPSKELAAIGNHIICGSIMKEQSGLNSFGIFSSPVSKPAPILNACCEIVALVTPKGVISKTFLEHFLQKGGVYGSLGVRFRQKKKGVVVSSVNPFVVTNLKQGDIVIALDGKRVKSFVAFNKTVLFLKPYTIHEITILREKKRKTLKQNVYRRVGGGYVSDTFFESLGIYLNDSLKVIASSSSSFKVGDTIFKVNGFFVKSYKDIRLALTKRVKHVTVGINRAGLDFFIKLKSKS